MCGAVSWRSASLIAGAILLHVGCSGGNEETPPESARPVSVLLLKNQIPTTVNRVSGSVGSWKVEDIGFEVSGRVEYVIEPEKNIQGRDVYLADDETAPPATELARVDPTRYQLQVASAKARLEAVKQQYEAVKIEENDVIPAQITAAKADEAFAKEDFRRKQGLFERDALSRQELDAARAKIDAATAQVAQLNATKDAKHAESVSLDSQVKQQENAVEEAERDLADCKLFSPFYGQVATVHVIPGGYVERGQPVVTVQMMDPIKIEFEVSAETVRTLDSNQPVEISFLEKDGKPRTQTAFVYQTDPTADPATRTFTVTLLMRNEKTRPEIPEKYQDVAYRKTQETWRIHYGVEEHRDKWFVEKKALDKDENGPFLWRVKMPEGTTDSLGPMFEVEKFPVEKGTVELSIVDLYRMVEIRPKSEDDWKPREWVFTDKLTPDPPEDTTPEPADDWDGKTVLLDDNKWLLRPGDLVTVHLEPNVSSTGFFVPINCIKEDAQGTAVFVVETSGAESTLKRTPVKLLETVGTQVRIERIDGEAFPEDTPIVAGYVHYLQDGETVRIAETVGSPK